jgi:hypothetical protein
VHLQNLIKKLFFEIPEYTSSEKDARKGIVSPFEDNLDSSAFLNQGCQIFLGNTYQNEEKYTRQPTNLTKGQMYSIPTIRKVDQLSIKPIPFQAPKKYTQIVIFRFKIYMYHLATLFSMR